MSAKKRKKDHEAELKADVLHIEKKACLFKHGSGKSKRKTNCDYPYNGFRKAADASRIGMYNKPVNVTGGDMDKAAADVEDAIATTRKNKLNKLLTRKVKADPAAVKRAQVKASNAAARANYKWKQALGRSRQYLEDFGETAWYVGNKADGQKPNFDPTNGGWTTPGYSRVTSGSYPWVHNWHHMVATDEVYVVLTKGEDDVHLLRALMETGYNIHHEDNMVHLPLEYWIARALKIPTHCPYNSPSHPQYSKYVSTVLKDVRKLLRQAKPDPCVATDIEVAKQARQELERVCEKLLRIIREMGAADLEEIARFADWWPLTH